MPSTSTWPNCSRTLGRTTTSAAERNSLSSRWVCQPARKTSSAPVRRIVSSGCSPSHSPGKPPSTTSGARRAKRGRAAACASISSGRRLTAVKRPTYSTTGPSAAKPRRSSCGVADRARRLPGRPAARLAHEPLVPELQPVDVAGPEDAGVEPVRDDHAAPRIDAEHPLRAVHVRVREDDQPLAARRPAPHPLAPGLEVRPAVRRAPRASGAPSRGGGRRPGRAARPAPRRR